MNNFFINITNDLELKKDKLNKNIDKLNNVEYILKAFESLASIEKIKKVNTTEKFYFLHVSGEKVRKFIMNLNALKPPL